MDHHRVSFLSYILAPKPRTVYRDVSQQVLQNDKLEQAIHETAREQLNQTQNSKQMQTTRRRFSKRLSLDQFWLGQQTTKTIDCISSSNSHTSSTDRTVSSASQSSSSEASSPLNENGKPFAFDTLTSTTSRVQSCDNLTFVSIDSNEGDNGSRSLLLRSKANLNTSNDDLTASIDSVRPRTAAALVSYEQRFARLVADQKQRASNLLREMRTCVSSLLMRIAGWILIKVLCRLFSNILYRPSEFRVLKETIRQQKGPLVFLPMHRSHLDYVLIHFVLFMRGVAPPLVAAGDNLNIPFFGTLMRGLGAFYIRRRMDPIPNVRDNVYRALLQAYVTENLKLNQSLEFFIEGARSRTGKLLLPKAGLLSVIVDGVLNNQIPDVQLVPVGVSYEKLVDGGFISEQLGANKRKEGFWLAVKSIWKRLSVGHFGDVRITFGQPFSLRQFVAQQEQKLLEGSSLLPTSQSPSHSPDLLKYTPDAQKVYLDQTAIHSLFEDMSSCSQNSFLSRKASNQFEPISRRLVWSCDTFGRHRSDQCVACKANSSNLTLSSDMPMPMITMTAERRRQFIQKLADHVSYSAFSNCAVLDTHALSALLLYRHRKGCTLKQLSHSLENLRELLQQRGRECGQLNRPQVAVAAALKLLGKECVHWMKARLESVDLSEQECEQVAKLDESPEQTPLFIVRPNVRSPSVLQLHYYANSCTAVFALDSVLATVMATPNYGSATASDFGLRFGQSSYCLERISVDSGLGVDAPPEPVRLLRSECISRAERLCELLRYEFLFVPPCVRIRDALEHVFDEYLASGWIQPVQLSSFERAQLGRRRRTTDHSVSFAEHSDSSTSSFYSTSNVSVNCSSAFVPSSSPASCSLSLAHTSSNLPNRRYQLDSAHHDKIRFMQSMLAPLLESYSMLVSCLHFLLNNSLDEKSFLKLVLEQGRQCLDSDALQFEESLASEPFKNALKLLEHEKVLLIEERSGIRRLRLTTRYRNENNLKTLFAQFQQFRL